MTPNTKRLVQTSPYPYIIVPRLTAGLSINPCENLGGEFMFNEAAAEMALVNTS